MLFYVPERMFRCFEQHLMQNQDRWKHNVLPWPAQNEFENAMSIEFDFNHPSDTTRSGNPIYRVTGQKEGFVDTGKFHEHLLWRCQETSHQVADADLCAFPLVSAPDPSDNLCAFLLGSVPKSNEKASLTLGNAIEELHVLPNKPR